MAQKLLNMLKTWSLEGKPKEVEITPVVDASKYFEDGQYVFVDTKRS